MTILFKSFEFFQMNKTLECVAHLTTKRLKELQEKGKNPWDSVGDAKRDLPSNERRLPIGKPKPKPKPVQPPAPLSPKITMRTISVNVSTHWKQEPRTFEVSYAENDPSVTLELVFQEFATGKDASESQENWRVYTPDGKVHHMHLF